MHVNPKLSSLFWYGIAAIVQPTTIVSLFGPVILHLNLTLLKGSVAMSNGDAIIKEIIKNPITVALTEWEIQFYTYVMAMVFCVVQAIFYYLEYVKSNFTAQKIASIRRDAFVIMAIAMFVVVVIVFVYIAFGASANEHVIRMYEPPLSDPDALEFALPPIRSPITWGRFIVTVSGILMAIAARRHGIRLLPKKP